MSRSDLRDALLRRIKRKIQKSKTNELDTLATLASYVGQPECVRSRHSWLIRMKRVPWWVPPKRRRSLQALLFLRESLTSDNLMRILADPMFKCNLETLRAFRDGTPKLQRHNRHAPSLFWVIDNILKGDQQRLDIEIQRLLAQRRGPEELTIERSSPVFGLPED